MRGAALGQGRAWESVTITVLVGLAALLVLPAPAEGAFVRAPIYDWDSGDECGFFHILEYEARPGEVNDVLIESHRSVSGPNPSPGFGCPRLVPQGIVVAEFEAPLEPSDFCSDASSGAFGPRLVHCTAGRGFYWLEIQTMDRADRIRVLDAEPAFIDAGPGADAINVRNETADFVTCGPGFDTGVADPYDFVEPDCEQITTF